MAKKEIKKYLDSQYCVVVPVYYENEKSPAWRKMYVGSLEECEKEFDLYPDFLSATFEENAENRKNRRAEYLFLLSIGKKKQAEKIREQFDF